MKHKSPFTSRVSTQEEPEETADSRTLNNIPEEMWGGRKKWKPHEDYPEVNSNGRLIQGPKHVRRHTEFDSIQCHGQKTRGGRCTRNVRVPSELLERVEERDLDTATFGYCFCIFHQRQAPIRPDGSREFRDGHRDLQTLADGDRFEIIGIETAHRGSLIWDYEGLDSPACVLEGRITRESVKYLIIETNRGMIGALPGHCHFPVDELMMFDPDGFMVEVVDVQGLRVLASHDGANESDQMPDTGQRQTPAYRD